MLLTDRRRSFGVRDQQHEQDHGQDSLFEPDSLAPPARAPGPTPDPFARARATAAPPVPRELDVPADAAPAELAAPADVAPAGPIGPAEYLYDPTERQPAHARPAVVRNVLAGPTLDDIMSRVWEGLRAEVPTPCPVCHTEIEPSAGGRCAACGSTLD